MFEARFKPIKIVSECFLFEVYEIFEKNLKFGKNWGEHNFWTRAPISKQKPRRNSHEKSKKRLLLMMSRKCEMLWEIGRQKCLIFAQGSTRD